MGPLFSLTRIVILKWARVAPGKLLEGVYVRADDNCIIVVSLDIGHSAVACRLDVGSQAARRIRLVIFISDELRV